MAKKRRRQQPRRRPAAPPPSEERRNQPIFNLRPEPLTDERRAVLEHVPVWARTLRVRSGLIVGLAVVGGVIAYNAAGRVAGPAAAGLLMVGVGVALWRADKLETRARERLEAADNG